MADIQLLLEAERRGLLPPDKQALLDEARRRGLIEGGAAPQEPEPERTLGGYTKETLKGLGAGLVGLGETAVTGAAALLPEEQERAVRESVTGVTQPIQEYLAPEAGYEGTIPRKLSEAVGSTLPFLPLGVLGAAGRAAATGLGVAAGAGEARQRAEQEAATEGERAAATALGTIPGALESLPPIRILRRFGFGDEAIQEVAGLAPALTRVAKAGGEEALQEASSQVLQNLIAKGVYKPEEAVFGGVGEAAALGGGAGAIVSAIAELALGRRLRGPGEVEGAEPPPPPPPPEGTTEEVTTEPATTIPSEAFGAAKDYVSKVDSGEIKFNLFKARKLIRDMGYEIGNDSKLADTKSLLNEIVVGRETDIGMLATGEFAPEGEAAPEVPSGAVTTTTGEVVSGAGRRGAPVPPLGEGAEEPEVTTTEPAGVAPPVVSTEAPDVGEGSVRPALTELTASNLDEVQSIFSGLQTGDKIVNDMGDEFVVGDIIRAKRNGPIVAVLDAQTNQPLKVEEVAGLLLPSPYTDASTGERKLSGAGKVIKVAAPEAEPTVKTALKRPEYGVRAASNLLNFAKTALRTEAIDNPTYFYISNELKKEQPNISEVRSLLTKAAKSMGMDVVKAQPKLDKNFVLSKESDRDVLSHIADIMLQNAPSEQENFDYAEGKLDPFGMQKEEIEVIKSKPGMNARRMAKMTGPQLYDDPASMGPVTIKEILQNSFDSIKGLIDAGQLDRGRIDIDVDEDNRTIEMLDNGAGMSPQLLATKFLEIAGTGKDAKTPSGGFGIAKMLFLYGNTGIRVVTMKDGKVSEMVTDGPTLNDALENSESAPDILVRKPTATDMEMFPDGHGVYISLGIPESFEDPKTGDSISVNFPTYSGSIPALTNSPLFSNIDVTFNNKNRPWRGRDQLNIGSKFPQDKFAEFANVKFPWGNARIYVAESPNTRYGDNLYVLSNGLYQFSQRVSKNPTDMYADPVPFEFYVDIKPTVKADELGYPFILSRQDFTKQAKKDYNKVLGYINALYAYQSLSSEAQSFGTIQYLDSPTSISDPVEVKPTVPPQQTAFAGIQRGDKVTVEDGKLFVRGKELPELNPDDLRAGIPSTDQLKVDPSMIDPGKVMLHDNIEIVATGQSFSDFMREQFGNAYDGFIFEVGKIFQELRKEVARTMNYSDLTNEAVGISLDPEYRGVSIRVPFSGSFINPFAAESSDTIEGALGTFGTMIHELAHHQVRGHDAKFAAEMQRITYKFRADSKPVYDRLERDLVNLFGKNKAIVEEGRRILNEGSRDRSIRSRGKRFEDGSREDVRKGKSAGVPKGKRGPSGKQRAGKPVQPKPVPSAKPAGKGAVAAPSAPTVAPSGPVDSRGQTPDQAIKTREETIRLRYTKPKLTDRILKYLWGNEAGSRRLDKYEALAKKFQSDLRPAFQVERDLKRAGDLITYGPGMNDAYTKLTNAQDKAAWLASTMLKVPMDRAYKAVEKYAKSKNLDTAKAIEELDRFRIVLHEPERRMIMFMLYAPLSTKRRAFRDSNGRTIQISPAELRNEIMKKLVEPGVDLVSNGMDKQLNKVMKALVSDPRNLDPLGDSPIKKEGKPLSTNINDDQYSVLGGYSPAFINEWKAKYDALGTQKVNADEAIKALEDVQDITRDLNRMAGYWSKPVDNIVGFYDFKHYTPFKGAPGTKVRAEAEMTDPNDVRISGEFADADQAMEGRQSEADNSVLQTLSDALYAASRAGRAGVTEAVKNLIEQGHISGKKVAEITHAQRYLDRDFNMKQFKGKNKIFHYNTDGNIEVYEIANKDMPFLESIRRPYQLDNWAVKMGNNITGLVGQMHTRFNPSFAMLNFPRDIFTNTLAIAADVGGKEAAQYLSDALFRNVMKGGLFKSGKISKLVHEGKAEELFKLAKKDPFYQDVLEFMQEGGRTIYQQSYNIGSQAEELEKMIGPTGTLSLKQKSIDAITKWADIYNDSFEFTNRVAAYGVMKGNVMARLKNEFRERNQREPNKQELSQIDQAAKTEAASFAKNLANFRLVGTAGREAGALFMFFRAASTGAVRAIDSILPALVDEKTALSKAPESVRDNPESAKRFLKNFRENKRRAQWTIFLTSAAGAFLYTLALAGADDDEEGRNKVATDDMARWTRYARLPILGRDTVLQIPWGFGISAFGSMGAQIAALAHGNQKAKDAVANSVNIAFDSFIPVPKSNINVFDNFFGFLVDSVTPSAFRPVVEYAMNTDNLGNEIYNNRQSRYSDVFTGGSNVPEAYKDLAVLFYNLTGVEASPNSIYFWATNYVDALSRVATSTYDLRLFATGDREFRSVDDLDKILVPLDSFIGTRSNYDARQYEKVKEKIEDKQRRLNSLKFRSQEYLDYIEKNPYDLEMVDFYNKAINGELKTLQQDAKYIRMADDLSTQTRRDLLKENTRMQNMAKRAIIDTFEYAYGIKP